MGWNRIFIRKQKKINTFSKALVDNTAIRLEELGITDKVAQAKLIHSLMQETAAHVRRIQNATENQLDTIFQLYVDNLKRHLASAGIPDGATTEDFLLWFANEVVQSGISNVEN